MTGRTAEDPAGAPARAQVAPCGFVLGANDSQSDGEEPQLNNLARPAPPVNTRPAVQTPVWGSSHRAGSLLSPWPPGYSDATWLAAVPPSARWPSVSALVRSRFAAASALSVGMSFRGETTTSLAFRIASSAWRLLSTNALCSPCFNSRRREAVLPAMASTTTAGAVATAPVTEAVAGLPRTALVRPSASRNHGSGALAVLGIADQPASDAGAGPLPPSGSQ